MGKEGEGGLDGSGGVVSEDGVVVLAFVDFFGEFLDGSEVDLLVEFECFDGVLQFLYLLFVRFVYLKQIQCLSLKVT